MITKAMTVGLISGLLLSAGISTAKEAEKATAMPGEKSAVGMGNMSGGMSMMGMMDSAHGDCMAASDSLDKLLKTVQEARKSDDKTKMNAALLATESQIAVMKDHMGRCMNMMGMMGQMMGGEGMKGMKGGAAAPAPKQKKEESAEHEKHHPK